MGGSSSKEKFRRDSKQKREQTQQSRELEVLPSEQSPVSYEDNDTRNFGYDGHETVTYMDNHTDLYQFQENQRLDNPKYFYSGSGNGLYQRNRNSKSHLDETIVDEFVLSSENVNDTLQRRNSPIDRCEERQFRRPIRRHNSFNDNRFKFHDVQGNMMDYFPSRIRSNSLTYLNDRDFLFEGQYMGNRFTNVYNYNFPKPNQPISPSSSSIYNNQSSLGHGGIKRYSCGDYSDNTSWGDGSNSDCEEGLVLDSPDKPRVKRRHSDDDQNIDCLLDSNVNINEDKRSCSGLSFHTNTTRNSADTDIAGSLSDEECGALNILSFPSEWSSCAVNKTGYVHISLSSPEGKSVQKFFQRTCRSKDTRLSISGIIRIENPFLHTLYLLKKEEMAVKNGHVDELFLYHGTKKRLVPNICENNLNWRLYSEMHRFGKGVSFSPSAVYSSHYSDDRGCDRVLMLFKVLVSKSVLGTPEMNIPMDYQGVPYDTSIKEDVSVIVKYYDNEFYPLYKILYNKT